MASIERWSPSLSIVRSVISSQVRGHRRAHLRGESESLLENKVPANAAARRYRCDETNTVKPIVYPAAPTWVKIKNPCQQDLTLAAGGLVVQMRFTD